ncbi:MAG: hypothetical protein ACP5NV_03835 [Candidatus Woesearchaeota archaeon]
MTKQFLTKKHSRDKKKNEKTTSTHKKLEEFYTKEQKTREKIESTEEQIFEHLKNHTKKVLKR